MKWTFKQARHAEGLLRATFPAEVRALVQWGTVLVEDTGDVNPALRARHGDLVLSIQLRDQPGRLCTRVEQQRNVEERMMLRMHDYLGRTWQKLDLAREPGRLPPLVAILIYNGDRLWTAPTAFQDLIQWPGASSGAPARRPPPGQGTLPSVEPDPAAAWLAQHVPHFRMHLVDLHAGHMTGVDESALTPLGRVVLWCLSVAGDDELFESSIGRIAGSLSEVLQEPGATDALEVLLRYLAATHPRLPAEKIRSIVDSVSGPRGQEVIVSFLDEIKNEGKKEGREQGRKEGREEGQKEGRERGRQEALSRTLLQLLARRFGPVSKDVQKRVREAGERELSRWTLRVLDAATAEDVLRSQQRVPRQNGARSPRRPASRG